MMGGKSGTEKAADTRTKMTITIVQHSLRGSTNLILSLSLKRETKADLRMLLQITSGDEGYCQAFTCARQFCPKNLSPSYLLTSPIPPSGLAVEGTRFNRTNRGNGLKLIPRLNFPMIMGPVYGVIRMIPGQCPGLSLRSKVTEEATRRARSPKFPGQSLQSNQFIFQEPDDAFLRSGLFELVYVIHPKIRKSRCMRLTFGQKSTFIPNVFVVEEKFIKKVFGFITDINQ